VQTAGTATITYAAAHGLKPGDIITVGGANQAGYNGDHVVLTTPTSTTATFAVDSGTVTPATGTLTRTANYCSLMIWPAALGYYPKKAMEGIYKDVHAGSTVATWDFDFRWASTLWRMAPRGVVKIWHR